MATTRFIQNIQPNYREYFASISVAEQNDTIEFEFDSDFIMDEILLKGGGSNRYRITLTYPASQTVGILEDMGSPVSQWFLNEPNNRSKNWYQVPFKTILSIIVTNASPSSEQLSLLVMGRGA